LQVIQAVVQFLLVKMGVPGFMIPLLSSALASWISTASVDDLRRLWGWLREHGAQGLPDEPSFIARIQAAQGLPARPQGEPVEHAPGFIDFAARLKP
jgi:hypothetical protein